MMVFCFQSIIKDSYDHHAAIYFLLLDKLKEQRTNIGKGGADSKRRRPSTIAEQPGKVMPGVEAFQSLRLRTSSESEREQERNHSTKRQALTPERLEMRPTEHKCLTCNSPIMDNTTSTTSCVKCARLRMRRRNFAQPPPVGMSPGRESSDSGVSGGGSQEGGDMPGSQMTTHHPATNTTGAPTRLVKRDSYDKFSEKTSAQFSTLVRKLSEVEGISPNHILR